MIGKVVANKLIFYTFILDWQNIRPSENECQNSERYNVICRNIISSQCTQPVIARLSEQDVWKQDHTYLHATQGFVVMKA